MKLTNRRIWLITDTHFEHDKIIEYCARPRDFESKISRNTFRLIEWTDVLIHLGDVGLGNDEKIHNRYIIPLACKKWLVKGNHDSKSDNWYLNHGWDFVCDSFIGIYFGKKILFSHRPQQKTGICDINIHGHQHNDEHREKPKYYNKKHKLLAIEKYKYSPILLKTFLEQNE